MHCCPYQCPRSIAVTFQCENSNVLSKHCSENTEMARDEQWRGFWLGQESGPYRFPANLLSIGATAWLWALSGLCVCVCGVCVCVCLETRRVGFKFSFLCRGPERMGWGLWPMKTPPHPVQTYLQFFQTCQAKGPRTSKLSEMARGYQEPHSGDGARLFQELRFGNGKRLSQGPQFRSWQEAKPRTSTCWWQEAKPRTPQIPMGYYYPPMVDY